MEEQFNERDFFTEKLIKEAGLEKTSLHFTRDVMSAIKAREKVITYEPLISKKVWLLFAVVALLIAGVILSYPTSEITFFDKLPSANILDFTVPFPEFKFSKNTIYGFGFLALFLLQIPFLKQMIVRKE